MTFIEFIYLFIHFLLCVRYVVSRLLMQYFVGIHEENGLLFFELFTQPYPHTHKRTKSIATSYH